MNPMKFVMIALLLLAGLLFFALSRRRAARAEETAAMARSKSASARNKARVPDVSSNLKGVTASQTIEPLKPGARAKDDQYVDDR